MKRLTGLQRLCRDHGRMKCGDLWMVWDFVNECAVPEKDMPRNSARWKAGEAAHWREIQEAMLNGTKTTSSP